MAKKKFDTSKPHEHYCPTCYKDIYCATQNCEIPKRAECHECRSGAVLMSLDGEIGLWKKRPMRFEGDHARDNRRQGP